MPPSKRSEVKVEQEWARGSGGRMVPTGRARLVVDADVSAELAAQVADKLRRFVDEDTEPDGNEPFVGAGI